MVKNYIQFIRHFFIFLIILTIPIFAWTTPANISNTDSLSANPAVCQDKRGWLHVVWEDKTPGNYDIYYTFYNGTAWADTQNVSHNSNTCWRPDVAVDTLNRVHIVWGDYTTGRIMWTMYDGNTWSIPASISDEVPYSCHGPELDVSPVTNYVHCVWHDLGVVDIWHSFYDGNSWSIPGNVSDDPNDSGWPDVAVDSLGRIYVVWQDCPGPSDSTEIFYSRFDSISWTSPVNVSRTVGGSVDPRIAIDMDNNPRVVWEERKNGYSVYYTYFDGVDWVNPIRIDSSIAITPDIAIDKENKSYITWVKTNIEEIFNVVFLDSIQVITPENASNTDSFSARPSIVANSEYIHLIWLDFLEADIGHSEIFYSRRLLLGICDDGKRGTSFSLSQINIKNLYFSFSLSKPSLVHISFYNLAGMKVKEVFLGLLEKGTYNYYLSLDLPSGTYFFNLKADTYRYRKKFILFNP